ncbi:MAG: HesA/MoeB/ThiF family protein [Bacillota bacterium]
MDKERYYRQLIIPEIGEEGQKKLQNSKVLIVGAGGLGSPIAFYLAAAGIGVIGLLDKDKVDVSNLQRQIIHKTSTIGIPKVYSGQTVIKELNPEIKVKVYPQEINEQNVYNIIKDYDVVVAAVDNLKTRYLLNRSCIKLGIPLVEGGVYNWDGTVHTIIKGQGPCYNCLFPETDTPPKVPGVIGPIVGIVGSWQAIEVVKILLNTGELLTDRMLLIEGLYSKVSELKVSINAQCSVCK